jgi:superfamily II DNA helicase RecQ
VLDVGIGSGNTIRFYLPLLRDEMESVGMVVSPLTALMIDQVR